MKDTPFRELIPLPHQKRGYGVFLFDYLGDPREGAKFILDYSTFNKKEAERMVAYHTRDKIPAILTIYKRADRKWETLKQIDNPYVAPFLSMLEVLEKDKEVGSPKKYWKDFQDSFGKIVNPEFYAGSKKATKKKVLDLIESLKDSAHVRADVKAWSEEPERKHGDPGFWTSPPVFAKDSEWDDQNC